MNGGQLIISSERVVTPTGIRPASVHVADGTIVAVDAPRRTGTEVVDVGSLVVMPGIVDSHVHVNDPGRTEWEGFDSAGRSAAAGGVTTLLDMPLNSTPVTTSVFALETKVAAAQGRCRVDFGLWGGIVPGNSAQIEAMLDAGALACKCFLSHSGIDDFPPVTEADLRIAMPILAGCSASLLAHAELPGLIRPADPEADPKDYATFLATRPREAELEAISLLIRLSAETGCPVHIVHVSAANALPLIAEARRSGTPITAETCPHYLTLAAEDVPRGGTHFKCAPPIRERANREGLWSGLAGGSLDLIASDHSPCPPDLKALESGSFADAWGGISSLQLSLRVTWTEAARRGYDLHHIVRWMCEGPARLAGLAHKKGRLAEGYDADLVIFDPDTEARVDAGKLFHRHPLTPYEGSRLRGTVVATYVRGVLVFDRGAFPEVCPGRWLKRGEA
ncbi:MAG: allantoinase AllB [Gemmatimonadota bacterium]|nr:MAG: allantoinase AllB [Gemmatimonadota bacterium]